LPTTFRRTGLPVLLIAPLALTAAGCSGLDMSQFTQHGYVAPDLLPGDRQVGSWRRSAETRTLYRRAMTERLGVAAADRLRYWDLGRSVAQKYVLGATGRTLTVEIYDLAGPRGAFDVYSVIRDSALGKGNKFPQRGEKPLGLFGLGPATARVTKVGAQGLLFDHSIDYSPDEGKFVIFPSTTRAGAGNVRVLVFWAERFVFKLTERGGEKEAAEAALLAFGGKISAGLKKPFELAEAYVLQVEGAIPNSERYVPRRILGRAELPAGVVARWKGKTGQGILFVSVLETPKSAGYKFEKLRRACGGILAPDYAEGLFVGDMPGEGPVACFRHGRALVGLAGAAEAKERLAVLEAVRKRCSGEGGAPVIRPAAPRGVKKKGRE
jgi:hypothetical protein